MENLGIYGTWNGDGTFTKICCTCEKEFISKSFQKLRCPECMKPKPPKDYWCEVCGNGLTRKYRDPYTYKMHRLCPNHYLMVKVKHVPLQSLLNKEGVQSNG